jgi:hypothetical protein
MEGAILRVEEFAQLLGCTPTALRQRVAREQATSIVETGTGRGMAWEGTWMMNDARIDRTPTHRR